MEVISNKLTDLIVRKGVISKEDYGVYQYGLQTGLELMLCVLLCIIISKLLDTMIQSFVVALVMFSLRAYVCGIHMKKYISCLISSTVLITVGPFFVERLWISGNITLLLSLVLAVLIHKFSYETVAYHSDNKEIEFFTKQRIKALCFICMSIAILWILRKGNYLIQVCYGLIVTLVSVVLEKIKIHTIRRKDKHEKNNTD